MPPHAARPPSMGEARMYSPSVGPLLQSLLATLADIDFAFESDFEVVENSATNEALKRRIIEKLREQHRKRRAPYAQQIDALQKRVQSLVA